MSVFVHSWFFIFAEDLQGANNAPYWIAQSRAATGARNQGPIPTSLYRLKRNSDHVCPLLNILQVQAS